MAGDSLKDKAISKVALMSLALKLLTLFQELLPAFLIAYNNSLRQKAKNLELKLEHERVKNRVEARKKAGESQRTAEQVIDDMLNRRE